MARELLNGIRKTDRTSSGKDEPPKYNMSWDEIREELERKHGWKISRQRVGQYIIRAQAKIKKALEEMGYGDAAQENQSLEAAEADALPGDSAAIPGEN